MTAETQNRKLGKRLILGLSRLRSLPTNIRSPPHQPDGAEETVRIFDDLCAFGSPSSVSFISPFSHVNVWHAEQFTSFHLYSRRAPSAWTQSWFPPKLLGCPSAQDRKLEFPSTQRYFPSVSTSFKPIQVSPPFCCSWTKVFSSWLLMLTRFASVFRQSLVAFNHVSHLSLER